MSNDIFEGVFDAKPAPVVSPGLGPSGESPALDDHREGVRRALMGHVEREQKKRPNPFGFQSKPCDTFGLSGAAPKAPKRKKVDLNPWAQRWFTKRGWRFTRADRFDHALQRHFDFMGIFDYVCGSGGRTIGVQVTTYEHAADHRKKIRESKGFEKAKEMGWEVLLLLAKRNEHGRFDAVIEWMTNETADTSWAWGNAPGMGE